MSTAAPIRPILNITLKEPGKAPRKFARVVFPDGFTAEQIAQTAARFSPSEGFRCTLRRAGPTGFSLPLALADLPLHPASP